MPRRVLIVDDEPDVSLYLTTVLSQHDFEVDTAASVEAGWESLTERLPELVCLDIMMPKQSGITLYTRMKADKLLRNVPVLIISGVAREGEFDFRSFVADESVPLPDGYFEKPISLERFIATAKKLTSGARHHEPGGGNRHA